MKKIILLLLIQLICATAGFAQGSPWRANGEAISPRPDLKVIWQCSTKLPDQIWAYELLPNQFSPEIISNLLEMCSLTEKDKSQSDTNGMLFQNDNGSRRLSISFSGGNIDYETSEVRYSPTNLAVGVPSTNELPEIAKNVFGGLHIDFSCITGWHGTNKIDFSAPISMFFVGDATITNIPYRTVYFRRTVDGIPIFGHFYRFNVGEHGKIIKISIAWPNLNRIESYRTVSSKDVTNFIRNGNAIHGPVPSKIEGIDWPSIKSVTIKKAEPSYEIYSDRLYPFLRLDVLVDTGYAIVEIAMDCPIFDESKWQ